MSEDELAEDVAIVVAHQTMDGVTLRRHLNARHLPISGVPALPVEHWRDALEPFSLWRTWHDTLHRLAIPHGVVNGHVHDTEEPQ